MTYSEARPPAISLRNVVKTYPPTKRTPQRTVLRGVDLEVRRGEVFALLGPNGAGKTTLVECCIGFRRPDSGEVFVLDTRRTDADIRWRARIGVVLQQSATVDSSTVTETLAMQAAYVTSPMTIDETLSRIGLSARRNQMVSKLSGGEARRLDVGCGIITRPELLFLDEPTTGFDPEARRSFWELIRSLQDDGTTIVLTTHYLDEAEALASRVGVLHGGRIAAIGTSAELRDSNRSVHVRWSDSDGSHSVDTHEPTALLRRLANQHDGEIRGLSVVPQSLEDVYLSIVGVSVGHVEQTSTPSNASNEAVAL